MASPATRNQSYVLSLESPSLPSLKEESPGASGSSPTNGSSTHLPRRAQAQASSAPGTSRTAPWGTPSWSIPRQRGRGEFEGRKGRARGRGGPQSGHPPLPPPPPRDLVRSGSMAAAWRPCSGLLRALRSPVRPGAGDSGLACSGCPLGGTGRAGNERVGQGARASAASPRALAGSALWTRRSAGPGVVDTRAPGKQRTERGARPGPRGPWRPLPGAPLCGSRVRLRRTRGRCPP